LSIDDIVKLPGDAARGREVATRCLVCHTIAGAGADVGPSLDGWARGKSVAVIARAIVQPSAEIAEGFAGTELQTTDGLRIQGIVIKQGDPLMVRSQGGVTQIVPAKRIASRTRMTESLMLTPAQLGLTGQDVADLIAFLRTR
jgi:putative heme-binding domain-containing protein